MELTDKTKYIFSKKMFLHRNTKTKTNSSNTDMYSLFTEYFIIYPSALIYCISKIISKRNCSTTQSQLFRCCMNLKEIISKKKFSKHKNSFCLSLLHKQWYHFFSQQMTIMSSLPETSNKKVFWKYVTNWQENTHAKLYDSIKLQSNFIEITLQHGRSPVNLLHILVTFFQKKTSGGLLLTVHEWVIHAILHETQYLNILFVNIYKVCSKYSECPRSSQTI